MSSVKQEFILEAAIKRFSHFGINKTTLTEIADDLSVSKQSLFYYFPDKQSLIAAVEERIIEEYIDMLGKACDRAANLEEALLEMIDIRSRFVKKYYMLALQFQGNEAVAGAPAIGSIKQKLRQKELALLVMLFEKGIAVKELKPLDALKTCSLILETLSALAYCMQDRTMIPDRETFAASSQKQKEIIQLFYNGLRNDN